MRLIKAGFRNALSRIKLRNNSLSQNFEFENDKK